MLLSRKLYYLENFSFGKVVNGLNSIWMKCRHFLLGHEKHYKNTLWSFLERSFTTLRIMGLENCWLFKTGNLFNCVPIKTCKIFVIKASMKVFIWESTYRRYLVMTVLENLVIIDPCYKFIILMYSTCCIDATPYWFPGGGDLITFNCSQYVQILAYV